MASHFSFHVAEATKLGQLLQGSSLSKQLGLQLRCRHSGLPPPSNKEQRKGSVQNFKRGSSQTSERSVGSEIFNEEAMSEKVTHAYSNSEVQKLNDPNFLVELALGPPNPSLVPQQPRTGLTLGGQYSSGPRSFVFKKAHFSFDDNRIFDESGELVLVTHHPGKNPYDALDPLGLANTDSVVAPLGEWESFCDATGYRGMPDFKVRAAHMSLHGRQYVQDPEGNVTYFNVSKMSRLKTMSLRHNLQVCKGDGKDLVYTVLLDLTGRSIQLVNEREELEAIMTKSTKTLIMNAAFGAGSELQIDVAPGVDWTAILAVLIGIKQVGKSLAGDAFGNMLDSATGAATGAAVDYAADPANLEELSGMAEGLDLNGVGESVEEAADAVGEDAGGVIGGIFEIIGSFFEE
ncbi:hypothetical protein R1flu_012098 [Riccia fluitans]|uniref:Uncharacterized protein n=1 Tax=Riccia fluitans TaxID=41844 RepID=A0ABD1Z9P0_9MARC